MKAHPINPFAYFSPDFNLLALYNPEL